MLLFPHFPWHCILDSDLNVLCARHVFAIGWSSGTIFVLNTRSASANGGWIGLVIRATPLAVGRVLASRWFMGKACHSIQSFLGGHPWFGQWNPVVNEWLGQPAHISSRIYAPDPLQMSAKVVTFR